MPRTPEEAIAWARSQVDRPTQGWARLCLSFVRQAYGVDYVGDWPTSARNAGTAWDRAKDRVLTSDPTAIPRGVPVFWETPGEADHVALSLGGGLCLSNDYKRDGRIDVVRIADIARDWGPLVGYSRDLVGNRIYQGGVDMPAQIEPPSPPYVGPAPFHGAANNKPVRRIVIHCTAGAEPGQENAARNTAAFTKRGTVKSSYHYVADARESLQLVFDSVVAWHDGTNSNSIGYELCCSLSNQGGVVAKMKAGAKALTHWQTSSHQAMLKIAAEDVARLCLAYDVPIRWLKPGEVRSGSKGICGHVDMRDAFPGSTTHWDPGPFFPRRRFLRMVRKAAKALTNPTPAPDPTPEPEPEPEGTGFVVASANIKGGKNRREAEGLAALTLKVRDDSGRWLDVIGVQEADELLDHATVTAEHDGKSMVYDVLGGDYGLALLVKRTEHIKHGTVRFTKGAAAIGDGMNNHARGILTCDVTKRGVTVPFVVTHLHVVDEVALADKDPKDWPLPGRSHAAHAGKVQGIVTQQRDLGRVPVVLADANAGIRSQWTGSLANHLREAGFDVVGNKVDLIAAPAGMFEGAPRVYPARLVGGDHDVVVASLRTEVSS